METDMIDKAREYVRLEKNAHFRSEVEELLKKGGEEAIRDRFYRDLDFGTGGMRGEIGGGYNRMNTYTVARASQGLAQYILKSGGGKHVAVAYDSRNFSKEFALQTALVMAANNIKCSLFDALRPTPELSFALRKLGATAGVVITASHNPAEYNGYKVYWSDGCQITPPHDGGIIEEVRSVQGEIALMGEEEARSKNLLSSLGKEMDDRYIAMVKSLSLRPELFKDHSVSAVYTPLHGAGRMPVTEVLRGMGVDPFVVPEQAEPDGCFPTVDFPNPEIASAMALSLKYAKERKADLILGTDPDSDRLGIGAADGGEYRLISGNQLGALLLDYMLATHREAGTMPENPVFVNTIVTSPLQNAIADSYSVDSFRLLTGFKYIGEKIGEMERDGSGSYVFGCEESYGYIVGGNGQPGNTDVRDKDAVSAALLAVEMALWNVHVKKRTVFDHLNDICLRFGYHEDRLISHYFKGESGAAVMSGMMENFRKSPPAKWGAVPVETVRDIRSGESLDILSGERRNDIDLPPSNVLQFVCGENTLITVRPSGTEPKIKFYISCSDKPVSRGRLEESKRRTAEKAAGIISEVEAMIEREIKEFERMR